MSKVMVKAAVEADLELYAGLFDGVDNGKNLFRCEVNGLFAENVLAGLCGFNGNVCVSIG